MLKILLTGVGRRIELLQAFRSAALVLNKELKIYGADMVGTAPALAYCDYTRKVVAMNDPAYIQNLIDICVADKIDLLIPTIDMDLLVLSENKDRFNEIGTKVMISAPDKIRICREIIVSNIGEGNIPVMNHSFRGQEYLGLYPHLEYEKVQREDKYDFWGYNQEDTRKYIISRGWLEGYKPCNH